jgi:hypothetical protein
MKYSSAVGGTVLILEVEALLRSEVGHGRFWWIRGLILVDFQGGVSSVGAWDCRLVHPGDGPYPLGGLLALIARSTEAGQAKIDDGICHSQDSLRPSLCRNSQSEVGLAAQ